MNGMLIIANIRRGCCQSKRKRRAPRILCCTWVERLVRKTCGREASRLSLYAQNGNSNHSVFLNIEMDCKSKYLFNNEYTM